MTVGLALYGLGVLAGVLLLWRIPTLPAGGRDDGGVRPAVAVVVPARDEARRIGGLLGALAAQLRPGDEAVVVDDESRDATAALAAATPGIRVVAAPPGRPPGWVGKTWAAQAGADATANPLLVFLDADVTPGPATLDRLAAVSTVTGGPAALVSVQPFHEMRRPYERLSLFPNLLAWMGTGACTPFGRRAAGRLAFGPVLALRRADYERIGGHGAVRSLIAEDIGFARRLAPVAVFGGRRSGVTFRMYPEGVRSLVQGWTKVLAAGVGATPWWALALSAAWMASLAGGVAAHPLCYLVSAAQLWWMGRRVGRYGPLTALAYVIPLAFFLVVLARSIVVKATGRTVSWRGRRVRA